MRYKMDIEKICNEVLDVLNPCYDIEMSLRNSFITVIKYLALNSSFNSRKRFQSTFQDVG